MHLTLCDDDDAVLVKDTVAVFVMSLRAVRMKRGVRRGGGSDARAVACGEVRTDKLLLKTALPEILSVLPAPA